MCKYSKAILLITTSLVLISCGGGNGNSTTATNEGRFKDSNVDGLSYTGSHPGTTKNGGKFNFETGDTLTFSIGNIELGSIVAKTTITPIDLITGGNLSTTKVQNIVRLLMALDSDGNPDNGINITEAVRTSMKDYSTLSLTTVNVSLDNIISSAKAAHPEGTYAATTASVAKTHLEKTLRCNYAGGYQGKINDTHAFSVIVHANAKAQLIAPKLDITSAELFSSEINFATDTLSVVIPATNNVHDTITLTFSDVNNFSGKIGTTNTFTASRVGGSIDAKYRFTGFYSGGDYGVFALDIDQTKSIVTGVAYSIKDGAFNLTANITSAGVLTGKGDNGSTIAATINFISGAVTDAKWANSDKATSGTAVGSGCMLN